MTETTAPSQPIATSSGDASIDFLASSSPSARPRQVHTTCSGGHTQTRAHSRNWCFTIRSSPEW